MMQHDATQCNIMRLLYFFCSPCTAYLSNVYGGHCEPLGLLYPERHGQGLETELTERQKTKTGENK